MLRTSLTHPGLICGLAGSGHGARVLIADGNFPMSTAVRPGASIVHLNLRAGVVTVDEVLDVVREAVPVEAALVMRPSAGFEPPIFGRFRELLPGIDIGAVERQDFYEATRGPDLALAVATGDSRLFANILVTIGVVETPPPPSPVGNCP